MRNIHPGAPIAFVLLGLIGGGLLLYAWLNPMQVTNPQNDPDIDGKLMKLTTDFRDINPAFVTLVHKNWTDDGVVVLYTREFPNQNEERSGLNLEYWQKTLTGWKWVQGGGYGFGSRELFKEQSWLFFEYVPGEGGTLGFGEYPLPLIYGESLDSSIVRIEVMNPEGGESESATLVPIPSEGRMIWYVSVPFDISKPLEVKAYSAAGEIVESEIRTFP